jgi:hypothetical protein
MALTGREIIKEYLVSNGYDGLFNPKLCACGIDDLYPCGGEGVLDCKAGFWQPCDCNKHYFQIGEDKP